jgi:type I restriction enzyme M protein
MSDRVSTNLPGSLKLPGRSERMTLPQLETYLWGAAIILCGLVDAGDYKQYVFPLLFYKRLSDVWDEEYATALADSGDADYAREMANERFIIPDGAHWNDVRTVPRDVGQALRNAMRAIKAANPARLDGIFGDAPWTNKERLPDRTLKNLLEHFSAHSLSLANVPEDELGNAYEFLIKKFADDSGHTAQEFYTNRTVVHLMVQLLQPQPGREHLRSHRRHRRYAHLRPGRGQARRQRAPHPAPVRAGAQPHDRLHCPHEPGAARRRGF